MKFSIILCNVIAKKRVTKISTINSRNEFNAIIFRQLIDYVTNTVNLFKWLIINQLFTNYFCLDSLKFDEFIHILEYTACIR